MGDFQSVLLGSLAYFAFLTTNIEEGVGEGGEGGEKGGKVQARLWLERALLAEGAEGGVEGEGAVADKARTFYNVEAKKFQKKHSVASSLQGEEEDFLFGQFWGLRGGPPSTMTSSEGRCHGRGTGSRVKSLGRTKFGEAKG